MLNQRMIWLPDPHLQPFSLSEREEQTPSPHWGDTAPVRRGRGEGGSAARATLVLLLNLLLLFLASLPGAALADGPNRAALVVRFDDGRVQTRCVAFAGDEISGADLLARSGLDVVMDTVSGMGITICQIEGEGCAYPAEHCFCQCMGGSECAYWNYFYRDPGETEWIYSVLGAGGRKVRPGSVEGWVWGDGHTPPDDDLTFEAICASSTSVALTPMPVPDSPTPVTPVATLAPTTMPTPLPSPDPIPAAALPTATSLSTSDAAPAPALSIYWPFGLMVLALAATGVFTWLRHS